MAITAAVLALLIGTLLIPLATQIERKQIADTQQTLEEIREALVGFALSQSQPRLPCPHQAGGTPAGTETVGVSGMCVGCIAGPNNSVEGMVPWATLGIGAIDPWGNRYRYRVMCPYAARAPQTTVLSLTTGSNLSVCDDATCTQSLTVTTAENAPGAVILSHGPNGRGAVSADPTAGVGPQAAVSADEQANTDGNAVFVSHPPRSRDATAGDEFDDIVAWLSPHVLKSRLVAAGRLPAP
jgi:hypothetical protein